jgi:hypothetical protein
MSNANEHDAFVAAPREAVGPEAWTRACKTLPTIVMEWDELPPELHLELHLAPGADATAATRQIGRLFEALSDHDRAKGGEGLTCHMETTSQSASEAMLHGTLTPAGSGERIALQARLRETAREMEKQLALLDFVKQSAFQVG